MMISLLTDVPRGVPVEPRRSRPGLSEAWPGRSGAASTCHISRRQARGGIDADAPTRARRPGTAPTYATPPQPPQPQGRPGPSLAARRPRARMSATPSSGSLRHRRHHVDQKLHAPILRRPAGRRAREPRLRGGRLPCRTPPAKAQVVRVAHQDPVPPGPHPPPRPSTACRGSGTSSSRSRPQRHERGQPPVGQHPVHRPPVTAADQRGQRRHLRQQQAVPPGPPRHRARPCAWLSRRRANRCCDHPPAAVRPCTYRVSTLETTRSAPSATRAPPRPCRPAAGRSGGA